MSDVLAGFAADVGTGIINNMLARDNASVAYARQNRLMEKQNAMNNANIMSAPQLQAQGLRMAGFNPAMVNGAGSSPAATVSQGNADMAQTVPIEANPQNLLLDAQRENIEAQTRKLKAEVPKTEAETENTLVDTLLKRATTQQRQSETERVNQLNSQYKDQSAALTDHGKVLAQKWQSEPWYNNLAPDTKAAIDALADGSASLTVGGMDALERVIAAQGNLSDADAKLVRNSFANAVYASQFSDKRVFDAIAKEPLDKRKMLYKNYDHIDALMKKIEAEIPEIVAKTDNTQKATEMLKAQIKSFISSDLGYLKAKGYETGDFVPWVEQFAENALHDVADVGKAYVAGRGLGAGSVASKSASKPKAVPSSVPSYSEQGVQSFGFGRHKAKHYTDRKSGKEASTKQTSLF